MQPTRTIGEKLKCPICGKEFITTENTCFIISGGYTCSWECFSTESIKRQKERNKK